MSNTIIASRLKYCREANHKTQEQIGKLCGVHKSTVSRWESGETDKIGLPTLALLAELYHVSVAWLSGKDVPMIDDETVKKQHSKKIPVLGRVAAGYPVEAVENIIDYEEISEEMARSGEYFALQVKGDSMLPRFADGDIVIVRKQEDIDSGDIAIMLVNGDEATIKKVQKFENGINLIPSNPAYDVMTFTKKEIISLPVVCLGKVVELRAKF